MYNPHPKRKLLADMDKTQLLRMREEQDMSNSEIAAAVGCCDLTIRKLIGPMPEEMLKRKQRENGARNAVNRGRKSSEGGVYGGTQGTKLYAAA